MDPGKRLGAVLNRCHSVIGLSATLTAHGVPPRSARPGRRAQRRRRDSESLSPGAPVRRDRHLRHHALARPNPGVPAHRPANRRASPIRYRATAWRSFRVTPFSPRSPSICPTTGRTVLLQGREDGRAGTRGDPPRAPRSAGTASAAPGDGRWSVRRRGSTTPARACAVSRWSGRACRRRTWSTSCSRANMTNASTADSTTPMRFPE